MSIFKASGLVAAVLLLGACDSAIVPLADTQSDAAGRRFDPAPAGQGTIYIVRQGGSGTLINIAVGPQVLGPLGSRTWFRADVAPGTVNVRCTGDESSRIIPVTVGAGATRFVEVESTSGWAGLRCAIKELPDAEGRQAVLQGKRAAELR